MRPLQGLLTARNHPEQHLRKDAVGGASPHRQTEFEEHRLQLTWTKVNSKEPKLLHLRPARHRALDLARVGESHKHDNVEEFWVFEGKVHDQFYEQKFKEIQDMCQRRLLDRHLIARPKTVDEEIQDKYHREWCGRQSLALASVVIHCGYRTLKAELWSSCIRDTLQCNSDVSYICAQNKANKVTVPVIDKDVCRLCHVICKRHGAQREGETSNGDCDSRQEVVLRSEHVVHFQDNPSCVSRTQGTTARGWKGFPLSPIPRTVDAVLILVVWVRRQEGRERENKNNTCLDGSDEKKERKNFVIVKLQSFTSFIGSVPVRSMETKKSNSVRLDNFSSQDCCTFCVFGITWHKTHPDDWNWRCCELWEHSRDE